MSVRARLLNTWLRWIERPALNRLARQDAAIRVRRRFEWQCRILCPVPRGVAQRWTERAGMEVLELGDPTGPQLLYLHGGAYVFGSHRTHKGLAGRLVKRIGGGAVVPHYPLAPESPFPAAPEAALRLYRQMAAQGPVVLAGDSAGGGLALSLLAMICADPDLPQPLATLVLSPLTDLAMTGDSLQTNDASEVVLPPEGIRVSALGYLDGADPQDPRASALYAQFPGAGPVHVWVGDGEVLLDDSRRMVDVLQGQGVAAHLTIAPGLPHVWPIFPGWLLPEAEVTLDQMAAAIR
ncbi:alpha/beta hydrolase [Nioella sp. MMSF_3534]|uniref:alpha/beta hydrolase n=1 Tax=Nioella sp. MMSF_3534 TaxID=3046720 RepID=UPI00273FBBEF|nr:alpha/beta hydrolase [Nioella sp. MMSF_3534]